MLSLNPESRVTLPPAVLWQELAGEAMLLNLDNEEYYGLDEVGTRMLAIVTKSPSIAAASEELLCEYDIDPATLRTDLYRLLEQLSEHGLVCIDLN
jgi:hypothetical protein